MTSTANPISGNGTFFTVGEAKRVDGESVKVVVGSGTRSRLNQARSELKTMLSAGAKGGMFKAYIDPSAEKKKAAIRRLNDELKGQAPESNTTAEVDSRR